MLRKTMTSSVLIASALLGSAMLSAPSASAARPMKTFTVTFAYDRTDPAEKIYASLQRTALNACRDQVRASIHAHVVNRKCAKQVIALVVDKMNRTDVAALHYGKQA
jgi:hypothetical protein